VTGEYVPTEQLVQVDEDIWYEVLEYLPETQLKQPVVSKSAG